MVASFGRWVVGGAMVVAAVCAHVGRVEACSALPAFSGTRFVWPGDGSQNVPLNARVVVQYPFSSGQSFDPPGADAGRGTLTDVMVRARGGAAVEAEVEVVYGGNLRPSVVLRPKRALEANTVYEVLDRVGTTQYCTTGCYGDYGVRTTFTTGSTVDTAPPTFAGLTGIDVGAKDVCRTDGCCGPYVVVGVRPTFAPATDDFGIVFYEVYADGERVLAFGGAKPRGDVVCERHSGPQADFTVSAGAAISVRAVDLAGNATTSALTAKVPAVCATSQDGASPDAGGAAPRRDGSTDARGGSSMDAGEIDWGQDQPACDCHLGAASGRRVPSVGWVALLGLGSLAFRRRRRSRFAGTSGRLRARP